MNSPYFGQHSGRPGWRWYVSATTFVVLVNIPLLVMMAILFSPLIFFLWNSLMPTLFGLKQISWLQAIGLFLLSRLLLSSQ